MDVLLARHAEPAAAAKGVFDDGGLSETGRDQARALGRALADLPLSICLVSPLERALETAAIVLAGRDVGLEVSADFAEGSLGALRGLRREQAERRFPSELRLGHTVVARLAASGQTAPDGETREELLARARRARARVERALGAEGAATLVVSHGGLLNYLLQLLLSVPPRDEACFGFDFCGFVRVRSYVERGPGGAPGLGPHPMLRFELPRR
jgi:probable phosphoglycerate mutase